MGSDLRHRLQRALAAAMARRDSVATSALRTALASIANAEAVAGPAERPAANAIELTPRGVGATEVQRRDVPDDEAAELVRREIADLELAAGMYAAAGDAGRAERALAQARVLRGVIGDPTGP